jgi:hypothetical protein
MNTWFDMGMGDAVGLGVKSFPVRRHRAMAKTRR